MPSVMMALGDYRFSVDSAAYQTLHRTHDYRWAAQERLGREPARQYLGPGDEKITLAGVIFPTYRGGLGQLTALRDEAGLGVPLLLVDGIGLVWGRYVIEKVEETRSIFFADGTPRRVEFSLDLAAYGEDSASGADAVVSTSPEIA